MTDSINSHRYQDDLNANQPAQNSSTMYQQAQNLLNEGQELFADNPSMNKGSAETTFTTGLQDIQQVCNNPSITHADKDAIQQTLDQISSMLSSMSAQLKQGITPAGDPSSTSENTPLQTLYKAGSTIQSIAQENQSKLSSTVYDMIYDTGGSMRDSAMDVEYGF